MAVKVNVYGSNTSSSEYLAALKLKKIILDSLAKNTFGEIAILTNCTLFGQEVKDVDILLIGNINDYSVPLNYFDRNKKKVFGEVGIKSFVTTIELKDHGASGIVRNGTDFYVKYHKGKKVDFHNVTEQSNKQKYSLKGFLEQAIGHSPYVTNIIWFNEITKSDLSELLRTATGKMQSNAISSDVTFKEILQIIVLQAYPRYDFEAYKYFLSCDNDLNVDEIKKTMDCFTQIKATQGELTRRRIEMISKEKTKSLLIKSFGDKLGIYKGDAGAGKTVVLLQTAINLVDDDNRVLLLTYNRALVSDLRRLISFLELPDLFDEACLSINTMHSFFYDLIKHIYYNGKLDYAYFLNNYEVCLNNIHELLIDEEIKMELQNYISMNMNLSWDYIMIDEAQDWSKAEQQLLLDLYDKNRIIVADGGKQFVRDIDICSWTIIPGKESKKLKTCLRQKNNIVKFNNSFVKKINEFQSGFSSIGEMTGGRVVIVEDKSQIINILKQEIDSVIKQGNVEYDVLCLCDYKHKKVIDGEEHFDLIVDFQNQGINIWDGVNDSIRRSAQVNNNQIRVLQYDSSRGLEGWLVCCYDFDRFISEKLKLFRFNEDSSKLMIESKEDAQKRYILNWALIPFTRAIDTLVITIDDSNSEMSRILKNISEENPDFVSWI